MYLQKLFSFVLFLCVRGVVGRDSNFKIAEEKRFPLSKKTSFLWVGGRRPDTHSNPLSFYLGAMD